MGPHMQEEEEEVGGAGGLFGDDDGASDNKQLTRSNVWLRQTRGINTSPDVLPSSQTSKHQYRVRNTEDALVGPSRGHNGLHPRAGVTYSKSCIKYTRLTAHAFT